MGSVLFVLLARIRHDFRILTRNRQRNRPGLREKFGIFKCDGPLDVVIVHLLKPFDQMQLIAVLMAQLAARVADLAAQGENVELVDRERMAALTGTDFYRGGMLDRRSGTVQ